ncbi:uncharacterized protein EV422DRAFT_130783 [Fimicolochytrium jonesii]|uniref:uncharacterized protein n=1 Tax=Fimicolochytrium jonesii TaxID=1396493 RepID=UPI0022FE2A20|nr:uncharacterized protein EV422DRAFT_130783 [Fimicolochytrium jonesii]KAI8819037.1 hypothetical protein EV422DRAFT_130783 [Fimicolochytrium jonesii]
MRMYRPFLWCITFPQHELRLESEAYPGRWPVTLLMPMYRPLLWCITFSEHDLSLGSEAYPGRRLVTLLLGSTRVIRSSPQHTFRENTLSMHVTMTENNLISISRRLRALSHVSFSLSEGSFFCPYSTNTVATGTLPYVYLTFVYLSLCVGVVPRTFKPYDEPRR